jgi:hypothetical protein
MKVLSTRNMYVLLYELCRLMAQHISAQLGQYQVLFHNGTGRHILKQHISNVQCESMMLILYYNCCIISKDKTILNCDGIIFHVIKTIKFK